MLEILKKKNNGTLLIRETKKIVFLYKSMLNTLSFHIYNYDTK